MKFKATGLPGILLIEPDVHRDARGFFFENYRKDLVAKNGVKTDFVQDNHSLSRKGSLRGLHYQVAPKGQAKLVRVIRGEVFDVAVDLRPRSGSFGRHFSTVLSAENKRMLFIPEGFAHGYLTLSDEAELLYKTSEVYSPKHERGLRWDDKDLGIPWPKAGAPYILSEKDKRFPGLKELK